MSKNSGVEEETLESMELKNQPPVVDRKTETINGKNSGGDNIETGSTLPPGCDDEKPIVNLTNSPSEPTDLEKEPSIEAKDEANDDPSDEDEGENKDKDERKDEDDDEETETDDEIIDADPISFVPPTPDAVLFNLGHPEKRRRPKDIYGRLAELEDQEWVKDTWMIEARERTNGKFDLFFHHKVFKHMCRSKIEVNDFMNGKGKKVRVQRDQQLTAYSEIFRRHGDYLISPGGNSVITTAGCRPRKPKNDVSVARKVEENEAKPTPSDDNKEHI